MFGRKKETPVREYDMDDPRTYDVTIYMMVNTMNTKLSHGQLCKLIDDFEKPKSQIFTITNDEKRYNQEVAISWDKVVFIAWQEIEE